MARLVIISSTLESRSFELKLGVNRIGRSSDNDFQIPHPTISNRHCEVAVSESGVLLRDLGSTNGTFVNGQRVSEVALAAGQIVRLGDIELLVDSVEITVAIPKFVDADLPAPPVVLTDGSMLCPRHQQSQAAFKCTVCREIMCDACVHRLRRRGSKRTLLLCPVCSSPVEPIDRRTKPKKKSIFTRTGETVKMKLARAFHLSK
ncbi:MAG TPA: FHA domain-containing protein [Verrucomicrobiota bacterium]|nr:FHA domain-containing protein [Verrucomicrobiota bacterium]